MNPDHNHQMLDDNAEEGRRLTLSGVLDASRFDVVVTDRDVLDAVSRYDSPPQAIESLLRIGSAAMFAASTGFDLAAVRYELNHAVEDTRKAMAELRDRVDVAIGDDGLLATSVKRASDNLVAALLKAAENQADPENPGTLLARIRDGVKSFDEMVSSTRRQVNEDLARSTQAQSDALNRAVRDIREIDPASPLAQALSNIDKRLADVSAAVTAGAARSAERAFGTAKGTDFEHDVAAAVACISAIYGDRAERTGDKEGQLVLNRRPSRRGDVTCFVEEAPRIVIEAMDRSKAALTAKLVRDELDEAMRNRGARAGIAVLSSANNTLMCSQPLQVLGPKMWAVVLHRESPSLIGLQVAYRLARHAATMDLEVSSVVDLGKVKDGIAQINRSLTLLNEVKVQLGNIRDCDSRAEAALTRYEREIAACVLQVMGSFIDVSDDQVA